MLFKQSELLDEIGEDIVRYIENSLGPNGLSRDRFSVTLLVHAPGADAGLPRGFSWRGDVPFYPCSVVKLFILAATHAALQDGRIALTPTLQRAMHDMIKWSSNTATNYLIDILTGTTGDVELPAPEMEAWVAARNSLNAWVQSLGVAEFDGVNVTQKLMDDDRYGREEAFVRWGGNNHNRLTTHAAAAMLSRIMNGHVVSQERSEQMAELLRRPLDPAFVTLPGAQVRGYLGERLPVDATLWSKAGWTGWTGDPLASYRRHDAIHVALASGLRYTLVVFTEGKDASASETLLPSIGEYVCTLLEARFRPEG